MYPDERLQFLSKRSCSNFYQLKRDLKNKPCCIALGAGASATVGLPVWSRLLKRICHSYFEQWTMAISSGKESEMNPPSDVSIALTNSYEAYLYQKDNPEYFENFENIFSNAEYWINGTKLSEEECKKRNTAMQKSMRLIHNTQDAFIDKIMSGDLTIVAQMIKNQVRPKDWNYLIRKSLYSSYEDNPYELIVSPLYNELIGVIKAFSIKTILNYNYDDTFYHALKSNHLSFVNSYEGNLKKGDCRIYYPHGFIPMKGGVTTNIVLSEDDYQSQIYTQNLWTNNVQATLFSTNTTVFIGLSLCDSNIRRIINMCSNSSNNTHYAFLPSSGDDMASTMYDSLYDADLFRLGIKVIRYSSGNDFMQLPLLIHYLYNM